MATEWLLGWFAAAAAHDRPIYYTFAYNRGVHHFIDIGQTYSCYLLNYKNTQNRDTYGVRLDNKTKDRF